MKKEEPSDTPQARFDTHVCLISEQATPNLTPLLDPAFRPAKRLVMLCSSEMKARSEWIRDLVVPRGLKVDTLDINDAWNLAAIRTMLFDWLAEQDPEERIALNATGGTKPMSMAAQQAFADADKKSVFYVRLDTDEVLWLGPDEPAQRLENRLKLGDFLHAHGWEVVERPKPSPTDRSRVELAADLSLNAGTLAEPLGLLNGLAQQASKDPRLHAVLSPNQLGNHGLAALIQKFERAGACRLIEDRLTFPNEETRFFCNGGWLEVHVAQVVEGIRADCRIQDLAAGLKVRSRDNRLKRNAATNEIDLAVLARNRLHIIECKTRQFKEQDSAEGSIYKLDALTSLGGLNTRPLLASYRELSESDRQRATDLGIQTIVGREIGRLKELLIKWIGKAK